MYTHVQRQFSTKREVCEFCFVLNTFTYVSSTKRDSVVGVKERSEWMVKWMAGSLQRPWGRWGCTVPRGPRPLPGPQESHAGPPQTSPSSGWSLVCSRSPTFPVGLGVDYSARKTLSCSPSHSASASKTPRIMLSMVPAVIL